MKFKIGDNVKFIGKDGGDTIPDYHTNSEGIPNEMIIHGDTELHKNYDKDFAEVVNIYKKFYLVRYKGIDGNFVQLGFKEKVLEGCKITNWRGIING